jgi:hypothetical protein
MLTKVCSTCKKEKDIEEFHNSKDDDAVYGKGKICKSCSHDYYEKHRQKMIEKHGEDGYRKLLWISKLRGVAKKAGIPSDDSINIEKIAKLKVRMIDYPDKGLPLSLSHIEFMKRYELNVDEYLYFRDLIKDGKFEVLNRKVYI